MFSPRVSASATLALAPLLALVAGCAHGGGASTPEAPGEPEAAESPPPSDPSTVTADDVEKARTEPIEQILGDRISGVDVVRTANGIAVRIRGTTSIHGDSAPLYVIDGIPVRPGLDGNLAGINPYDIESIEVLKDPANLTMYGVRGANGVILIKTKLGSP